LDKIKLSVYISIIALLLKANKLYALKSRENPPTEKQQNFIEQAARICNYTTSISKDNEAARRRLRRRI
jgi:hypothetical protein